MSVETNSRLNGECCEHCGMYIGKAVGYPKYCSEECEINSGAVTDPRGYSGWKENVADKLNKENCFCDGEGCEDCE